MRTPCRFLWVATALSLFASADGLRADQSSLTAVADTGISDGTPPNNGGDTTEVVAGTLGLGAALARSRALFRFDPSSSIPANAVITSVELRLFVAMTPSGAPSAIFDLHRMLVPWDELQANWTVRIDAGHPWDAPGGGANTDYAAPASASQTLTSAGAYAFGSTSSLVADVQAWVNTPGANHGWMLLTRDENLARSARRIAARENQLPDRPPQLVVNWTAPFHIDATEIVGDQIRLRFHGKAGKTYVIECRDALGVGNWQVLATLPIGGSDGERDFSETRAAALRFYRVIEQ